MTQPILHDIAVQYLEELCDAGMLLMSMCKSLMVPDSDKGLQLWQVDNQYKKNNMDEPSQMDTDDSYSGPTSLGLRVN